MLCLRSRLTSARERRLVLRRWVARWSCSTSCHEYSRLFPRFFPAGFFRVFAGMPNACHRRNTLGESPVSPETIRGVSSGYLRSCTGKTSRSGQRRL